MAGSDRPAPAVAETERLRLRDQAAEDIAFFAEMLGDPDTLVHWPRPLTYEEAERWIAQNQRRYAEDGFGWWAVELRETGELLGDCGLATYQIDGRSEVELGYHFHRRHWGNGYATEAAAACVDIARARGLTRLIALILPANEASQRVAARVGFAPERDVMHANMHHVLWSRTLP
jgi:[ribosomal protein S5]-alanine N-acetyltransferase